MARNVAPSHRGLSLYLGALAAAAAVASVAGAVVGRPAVAVIGVPLALLFGIAAWGLSDRGLRTYEEGRLARTQDRIFAGKVMRRLVPPPKPRDPERR
jgi:hypothetical protein